MEKARSHSEPSLIPELEKKRSVILKISSDQRDETYSCIVYEVGKKVVKKEAFQNCFVQWKLEVVSKGEYSEQQ